MNADSIIQLFGIVATALVAWWTLRSTFANERRKRDEEDAQRVSSFLGALATEINTLWPIYMEQYGKSLETLKEGERPGQFPVGDRYFVVYETNAHLLGSIPDPGLRDQIVRTYIVANGMLDTVRLDNTLAAAADEKAARWKVGSPEAQEIRTRWGAAVEYAVVMKAQHFKLKEEFTKLKNALKKYAGDKADSLYEIAQQSAW